MRFWDTASSSHLHTLWSGQAEFENTFPIAFCCSCVLSRPFRVEWACIDPTPPAFRNTHGASRAGGVGCSGCYLGVGSQLFTRTETFLEKRHPNIKAEWLLENGEACVGCVFDTLFLEPPLSAQLSCYHSCIHGIIKLVGTLKIISPGLVKPQAP